MKYDATFVTRHVVTGILRRIGAQAHNQKLQYRVVEHVLSLAVQQHGAYCGLWQILRELDHVVALHQ
jgi:hypothetical protein